MTDIDAALAELRERYGLPDIDEDDITLRMLVEGMRVTRWTAEKIMEAEVSAGRMVQRWVRGLDGKRTKAWRLLPPTPPG